MEPMERAIKDLCQLRDADLFREVATGISHIVDSATRLDSAAHKLTEHDHHHAARIIGNLAEEEAAKGLILLDAVRCPRNRSAEKARTLGYFYHHLAKGIYAEVYDCYPADFAEIARIVESDRKESYLDGPNDVDWIFPNRLMQRREDDLYVGYGREDSEDLEQAQRYWTCPHGDPLFPYETPPAINLIGALHQAGVTTEKGLYVVAKLWRAFEPKPETRTDELEHLNWCTIETLKERELLAVDDGKINGLIRDRWLFPLWPLDLRKKKVERAKLREIQERWTPDY